MSTMVTLFKSQRGNTNIVLPDGTVVGFAKGRFYTTDARLEAKLRRHAENYEYGIFIDQAEPEIDSEEVDPIEKIKREAVEEYKRAHGLMSGSGRLDVYRGLQAATVDVDKPGDPDAVSFSPAQGGQVRATEQGDVGTVGEALKVAEDRAKADQAKLASEGATDGTNTNKAPAVTGGTLAERLAAAKNKPN